tara:strand:+ start:342 stop:1817 length:1476 start_codon:yes stop_codon:yes gene_type:complete
LSDRTLILGGPGCGKTTALLNIVDALFKQGVEPNRLAYLAFTKKAAVEAQARAQEKFHYSSDELVYFRTIHSFTFKALNLTREEVMGSAAYKEIGQLLNLEFGTVDPELGLPVANGSGDRMAYLEQLARLTLRPLQDICMEHKVKYFDAKLYRDMVEKYKHNRAMVDFTDMLEKFMFVGKVPPLDVVIVDEAQDLSPLQWKVVEKICANVPTIYFGGDDDQAIYTWAGADVKHFLALDAKRKVLPISYRLSKPIFDKCTEIAKRIGNRYEKDWQPSTHEGSIQRYGKPEYLDCSKDSWLMLARNKHFLKEYKDHMITKGFPYMMGNRSSVDTPEVRALLAWEAFRAGKAVTLDQARAISKFLNPQLKGGDGSELKRWDGELIYPNDIVDILKPKATPDWMEALTIEGRKREYYRAIKTRGEALLGKPRIQIATIHTVKGGEADNVALMPDMARRSFDTMGDEEARVFYVAASRARYNLHLIHPQTERYFQL